MRGGGGDERLGRYAEQQYKLFTVYFQNRSHSSTFTYTVNVSVSRAKTVNL